MTWQDSVCLYFLCMCFSFDKTAGRCTGKSCMDLKEGHPGQTSWAHFRRAKPVIPVLKNCPSLLNDPEEHSMFMLCLFKPWRLPSDIKEAGQTWHQAFVLWKRELADSSRGKREVAEGRAILRRMHGRRKKLRKDLRASSKPTTA